MLDAAAGGGSSWTADSFGYQVNLLARLMARALNEALAPWGVTSGQFAQLLTLYEQDGLTAAELSRIVGIEPPTMARTLRRMERDGLVHREQDPADARRSYIRLTDRARTMESEVKEAATRINQRVLGPLEADERTALLDGLRVAVRGAAGAPPAG